MSKKSKRCKYKVRDGDGVGAPVACPSSCGSCACADSPTWFAKKAKHDCEYVSKNAKRCKAKVASDGGVSSLAACPFTCESC